MGKSTAAALLAELGGEVLDTDLIARQLVELGQPALNEVVEAFGDAIVDSQGRLRREVLARIVFSDAVARASLEAILHPRIHRTWLDQLDQWRTQDVRFAVVVIPLLFETDSRRHLDSVVCVACSARVQAQRLQSRGWSSEQIAGRLQAQWDIARKMMLSDYVVWSEGGMALTQEQLTRVLVEQGVAPLARGRRGSDE